MGSLGRKEEDGALERLEELLGLVCGRRLERNGTQSLFDVAFSLKNEKRLHFWEDVWCEEEAICFSFPSLFKLAAYKDVLVVDVWESLMEEGGRFPSFTRHFNDWEVDEALSLYLLFKEREFLQAKKI